MNEFILYFLIYIVVVVLIGYVSSKKETEEDFMIAERKVTGVQLAATMSAGCFDGTILALYFAYIYQYGFSAIWLFIGMFIGFYFFRRYASKIKEKADELKVYTMPEYYYRLFGKRNGIMFSIFLVTQFFFWLVVNFIVSGKVLSAMFPIPYVAAVGIGGMIILSYLLLAGFKAVMRTDFFQLAIMFIMCITVAGYLLSKTHIPSSEINFTKLGLGNIIGFIVLTGFGIMVAPDLWQRLIASKDTKTLRKGLGLSGFIILALGLTVSVLGLATKQFFPDIKPEDALVTGFSQLLPGALQAFGMVLLYAVSLSSSDTATFVISSIFTRDLKNYTKRYSDESMRKMTRILMVILVLAAMIIGMSYHKIVDIGLSLASLNLTLFPVVFGSLFWKLKEKAVFWSLVLSFLSVVVLFFTQQLTPENATLSLPVALFSLVAFQKLFKSNVIYQS